MQYKLSELLPDMNRNLCRKYLEMISELRFRHEYEILKNKYNTQDQLSGPSYI